MSRYFVIVKIPSGAVKLINTYFENKFGREMSATHVHMSLLPPFYLKDGIAEDELFKSIGDIDYKPFVAKFKGVRMSTQKTRKYLFLNVGPEDTCRQLASAVEGKLVSMINIDRTPYIDAVVPPYEAHVTIDYNFEGLVPEDFPEISFPIDKISMAKEMNGEWIDLAC